MAFIDNKKALIYSNLFLKLNSRIKYRNINCTQAEFKTLGYDIYFI